MWAMCPLRY
uniref:Uncharacterized protein n=1 Tax=Arundo donax TaxID=35708 RepID=A0A0A9H5Y2_ARUDO